MALAKSPRTGLRRKGHGQRTANGPAPSARERAPLPACIPARAEVERRVGLRRSAIYRRTRDKCFPQARPRHRLRHSLVAKERNRGVATHTHRCTRRRRARRGRSARRGGDGLSRLKPATDMYG